MNNGARLSDDQMTIEHTGHAAKFCPACGTNLHKSDTLSEENERLRERLQALSFQRPQRHEHDHVGSAGRYQEMQPPTGGPVAATNDPHRAPLAPLMNHTDVAATNQGLDFGAVARMLPEQLDGLPYGMITLDAEGRVIQYNDTESRLAGLPKGRVVGRNFFKEIAPCTRLREFEGRFRNLVADPTRVRVQTFDFVFRFAHSEQQVTVLIVPAKTHGHYNMALLRRSIVAAL